MDNAKAAVSSDLHNKEKKWQLRPFAKLSLPLWLLKKVEQQYWPHSGFGIPLTFSTHIGTITKVPYNNELSNPPHCWTYFAKLVQIQVHTVGFWWGWEILQSGSHTTSWFSSVWMTECLMHCHFPLSLLEDIIHTVMMRDNSSSIRT